MNPLLLPGPERPEAFSPSGLALLSVGSCSLPLPRSPPPPLQRTQQKDLQPRLRRRTRRVSAIRGRASCPSRRSSSPAAGTRASSPRTAGQPRREWPHVIPCAQKPTSRQLFKEMESSDILRLSAGRAPFLQLGLCTDTGMSQNSVSGPDSAGKLRPS